MYSRLRGFQGAGSRAKSPSEGGTGVSGGHRATGSDLGNLCREARAKSFEDL